MKHSDKPYSAACDRNREPILEVLRLTLTRPMRVLEVGSGTGQHAVHFAQALPHLTWQTSDVASNISGIRTWLDEARLPNTPSPLVLDADEAWPQLECDAAFSANTLHIMSWPQVQQTFQKLDAILKERAQLIVYGPFNYDGRFTSDSNAAFDGWLKAQSAHMGIRDFSAVDELARKAGFELTEDHAMPANNRTLVWRRGL